MNSKLIGFLTCMCLLETSLQATKSLKSEHVEHADTLFNVDRGLKTAYDRGRYMGHYVVDAFKMLAQGRVKKSTALKDTFMKKNKEFLSKIREDLALPWFYWGSEPLKTPEQKQAFKDIRDYNKGIGETLSEFDFPLFLSKQKLETSKEKKYKDAYSLLQKNCSEVAQIDVIEKAYEKWKEFDKELTRITKDLWN